MNKKIVVLGGGTGMSVLLRGLKQFPFDISAIVSVCDDGKSTGRIREEFNTLGLGDIRRVMTSLAETEPLFAEMINYRFKTKGEFNGHTVGNLLLVAMSEITGSVSSGIEALGKVLNLKGKVLPLTEETDNNLVAELIDGEIVEGEHNITEDPRAIKKVWFKNKTEANNDAIEVLQEADLIILSMGSLYTSIIPNLICPEIKQAIDNSNAEIMYVCNMMTQPGETEGYKVSDHVSALNEYLGNKKVKVVMVNTGQISAELADRYKTLEQKDPVEFDFIELQHMGVEVIEGNFAIVVDEILRHDTIKVAAQIFSYLL